MHRFFVVFFLCILSKRKKANINNNISKPNLALLNLANHVNSYSDEQKYTKIMCK